MVNAQTNADLAALVREIEEAVEHGGDCAKSVSGVLSREAKKCRILDGLVYEFDSDHYRRELLYADPQGRFSLLALIWQPGQMTPLHGHQTWCAVAVHTGELVETAYALSSEKMPHQTGERFLQPGSTTFDRPGGNVAHRLTNHSNGMAVSLHCYGVSADRVGQGVNIILNDVIPSVGA